MASVGTFKNMFSEVFEYREVFLNILSRDLKIKYRRTFFGYFWSLLNPLLQLGVVATVFSHIVQKGIKDYTLYLFSGLLAWNFFSSASQMSSRVFLENESFIKKIYLPKLLFPLSKVALRSVDFVFSLAALSLLGALTGFSLKPSVVALPLAMLLLFIFTLGVSLLVSTTTVFFRDVEYFYQVFLQLLYFATPIMYWEGLLPEKFRVVLSINPLLTQIRLFNRLIYEGVFPSLQEWGLAGGVALGTFGLGLWLLRKTEDDLVFRM